jgi:hypothetical protein
LSRAPSRLQSPISFFFVSWLALVAITMARWWVTLARTGHSQKLANDLHS